ncbi:DUF1553 domain-containing protein [Calycomorphotria hydatis]|uniref:Planctomycete cytochrome C n=1 Tax=Calycomorphotria hydatis TaxID=2528027 RepID=A0A517T436_9PLAN|nr:DUF1553 domain-containing protein [Calycomorphotria hydatis]QDT63137.1 Planctomycete cytochrome C [Calycomorphotria hydatis]
MNLPLKLISTSSCLLLVAVCCAPVLAEETATSESEATIDFREQIRPILSDRCYHCHGPDENNRAADLRLDEEDAAKEWAIVPGKPDESDVLLRVLSDDPDYQMPPPSSKISVTAKEKELLREWIAQGAPWAPHWAFVAPKKSEIPKVSKPDWVTNPIDAFVLSRLDRSKMSPSREATRETLLRRISFDLTGLPPTLEELDQYLSDTSPDAYEKAVDRLLASPRFGERMASMWLDVARYSDTYGYQVDRNRHVWPWRDWVIRAFNNNMPHDEFITQQLAGDLLPNATDEQILATTFNRLHPQKVEGGSVPEEFRTEYVADRTQTVGTAFMGLTLECARCHDHKFDPISQKNYYELFSFFNNIDEAGLYSYFTPSVPTPTLVLANEDYKSKLAALRDDVAAREQRLAELTVAAKEAFEAWSSETAAVQPVGEILHHDFDSEKAGAHKHIPGKVGGAWRLTGDDEVKLKGGNFHRYEPFSISLWMRTPDVKDRAVIYHRSRAWTDAASRGYELLLEDGRLSTALVHFWPGNAMRVQAKEPLPVNEWQHVTVTYDGSMKAAGLTIYVNGQPIETEVVRDSLTKEITGGGNDELTVGARFRDKGFKGGDVDDLRVFNRELTAPEVSLLINNESATPNSESLFNYYLQTVNTEWQQANADLQSARKELCAQQDAAEEIMVMREMDSPRDTYLLHRGAYDAPKDQVYADTPEVLPPFAEELPRNRLGLAKWMTDPSHPLTARVTVNRFWQLCFGEGFVKTPEDFGSQGAPPTHPALLDWLAVDFIEHGWDVKRLMKQILMSSTYRQDSYATHEQLAKDPENRLLARGPQFRLPAEMLRDNALAIAGLLRESVGGPPAKPYDLEESFKPINKGEGDSLYRRSLYTFWKRTAPAPVMMAFDASKRDVCRVKRERTSSPLQAFVLLNGPQFVEASRFIAARFRDEYGHAPEQFLPPMFRMATSRELQQRELKILQRLYAQQLDYFRQNPQKAKDYLAVGSQKLETTGEDEQELAAAGVVANALLNFHESVTKQ